MNMFRIIKVNFKRSCNRQLGFILNFSIPIIVIILGIFANRISRPSFSIGIINADSASNIVNMLSNTDGITVSKVNPDTIKIDLITGKFSAIVSFSDFNYKLFSIKDNKTNKKLNQIIEKYKTITTPVKIEEVIGIKMSIAERTIAFIVLFLMITATITASFMIKDKNNGTLKRYQYSPQKPSTYLIGNFAYNYLITFFQFFVSILFMKLLNINIGIWYGDLMLMGIWISGIATAFGTFFSSIFQKEMYANLFAAFTALVFSLIGGTFIVYENMPTMFQKISVISPLRWFIEITKNMERGINWFRNIQQVVTLSIMIFVLLLTVLFINKKTYLMQHFLKNIKIS